MYLDAPSREKAALPLALSPPKCYLDNKSLIFQNIAYRESANFHLNIRK